MYGTKRKSSENTAFKWANTMPSKEISLIEESCQVPMKRLGYAKYQKGASHSDILEKSFDEVWPYQ